MNIQAYEYNTPLSDMTDGMLIKLILAGEQRAFEPLIRRYERSLFNFICHFLGNYDLACDILQDVLLKLYVSLPTLHTDQPLKPWLFQVARNRCLDELRRKHPICFSQLEIAEEEDDVSPMAILPDTDPLPEEIAEHHEFQQILRQAIDELPLNFVKWCSCVTSGNSVLLRLVLSSICPRQLPRPISSGHDHYCVEHSALIESSIKRQQHRLLT